MTDSRSAFKAALQQLIASADAGTCQRGLGYAEGGWVRLQALSEAGVSARVRGSISYEVAIERSRAEAVTAVCDCPVAAQGELCKHAVATALVALGELADEDAAAPGAGGGPAGAPTADAHGQTAAAPSASLAATSSAGPAPAEARDPLHAFLLQQPTEALAEALLRCAAEDREVKRRLHFWRDVAEADTPAALRKALGRLIGTPRFLDWRASNRYAKRLQGVLDVLEQLTASAPERALDGAEYALKRLFKIYERADDSGGAVGDVLHRLARLHAGAADAAGLAPDKLATRLLKLQEADDWDVCHIRLYAPALGETGMAHYGEMLRRRWSEPGAPRGTRWLLEAWCEAAGAVDELIAIQSASLASVWDYVSVVQTCFHHDRLREALALAERGLRAHPESTQLMELVAECHERDGFAEEALPLRWRRFEASPDLNAFEALRRSAGEDWSQWRERAYAAIRKEEAEEMRRPAFAWASRPERPSVELRVRCLLAEGQVVAALDALSEGGVSLATGEALARAAAAVAPERARTLLTNLIDLQLSERTGRYDDIVALIERRLSISEPDEGAIFVQRLRSQYRAKRNFIAALDELGLEGAP